MDSREKRKDKTTYMSPESQNRFIRMLADECRQMIEAEISKAPFTAVIAGTTIDVSNDDQMAFVVRYVSEEGKPRERLLETKKVINKTGEGLAKAILQAAQERNLDTNTIRFQTYGSASTFNDVGKVPGSTTSSFRLVRTASYIYGMSTTWPNLVIEHGSDASFVIGSMYQTIEALYVYFSASTRRTHHLNEVMKMSGSNNLKLTNLSKTRWSA